MALDVVARTHPYPRQFSSRQPKNAALCRIETKTDLSLVSCVQGTTPFTTASSAPLKQGVAWNVASFGCVSNVNARPTPRRDHRR